MRDLLKKLINEPENFSLQTDLRDAIHEILDSFTNPSSHVIEAQIGSFLTAFHLLQKDYHPDSLETVAKLLLEYAEPVDRQQFNDGLLLDIVGTGGDGWDTFNASTTAALVVAGCETKRKLYVVKHGNRSSSSLCGSADLLEHSSYPLESPIQQRPFNFLFAPLYHPIMKHLAPIRKSLGFPTIFNLLGPLLNPLRPQIMVVGVNRKELGHPFAIVLKRLGVEKGFVVHSAEGLDEISPEKETFFWSIETGKEDLISPSDFGLEKHTIAEVQTKNAKENLDLFQKLIRNELPMGHPILDFVLMNASALLVAAGEASNWREGVQLAIRSIQAKKPYQLLQSF